MRDTLHLSCEHCRDAYILLAPEFVAHPAAPVIIGDALDTHRSVHCRQTCRQCHRRKADSDAHFCSSACSQAWRKRKREIAVEELLFLTGQGVPVAEALPRVGLTAYAVEGIAAREGREDLAALVSPGAWGRRRSCAA